MSLKEELEDPGLTLDALLSIYVREIKQRLATRDISLEHPSTLRIVGSEGRETKVFLDNLWIQLQDPVEPRLSIFERHFTALSSMMRPAPTISRANIVPLVKDNLYLQMAKDSPEPLVCDHLAGDIWIVYALDLPKTIQTLTKSQVEQLEIRPDELHALSVQNLRRILPDIQLHGSGPSYMLTAGGDYTASLLLVEDVWKQVEKSVDGEVVAVVPSRDVLLFTGTHSKEAIEEIRSRARKICDTGTYVISHTLLRRSSGKWVVFQPTES